MQLIKTTLLVILGFAVSAMALPEVVPEAIGAVERRDTVRPLHWLSQFCVNVIALLEAC
jgi:hypothetical protein